MPPKLPPIPYWIELALRAMRDEWDNSRVHPSDLGYGPSGSKCQRQLKLRLMGAEEKPMERETMLFLHMAHIIQREMSRLIQVGMAMDNKGWTFLTENKPVEVAPDCRGELDWLFVDSEGRRVVVDLKAVRSKKFGHLERNGNNVDDNYQAQVRAYVKGEDANGGSVVYADRGGENYMRHLPVEREDDKVDMDLAVLRIIRDGNDLPPIIPPKMTPLKSKPRNVKEYHHEIDGEWVKVEEAWQCAWCDYKGVSCEGALEKWRKEHGEEAGRSD